MRTVNDIERAVTSLSSEELTRFRAWFLEFDAHVRDRQFEAGCLGRQAVEPENEKKEES